MKCTATGYPEPTYEWIRLDEPLPVKAVGEHSALLIIPNFSVGDIGEYACVASNIAGVAESKPITPVLLGEGGFSLQYGMCIIHTNVIFKLSLCMHNMKLDDAGNILPLTPKQTVAGTQAYTCTHLLQFSRTTTDNNQFRELSL